MHRDRGAGVARARAHPPRSLRFRIARRHSGARARAISPVNSFGHSSGVPPLAVTVSTRLLARRTGFSVPGIARMFPIAPCPGCVGSPIAPPLLVPRRVGPGHREHVGMPPGRVGDDRLLFGCRVDHGDVTPRYARRAPGHDDHVPRWCPCGSRCGASGISCAAPGYALAERFARRDRGPADSTQRGCYATARGEPCDGSGGGKTA